MAEKIEFGTFVAPEKVNPYTEVVEKLSAAEDENASVTITVPAKDADKRRLAFQRAANAIGKTARVRLTDDSAVKVTGKDDKGKDVLAGDVKITFTLTKRHQNRRGEKSAKDSGK